MDQVRQIVNGQVVELPTTGSILRDIIEKARGNPEPPKSPVTLVDKSKAYIPDYLRLGKNAKFYINEPWKSKGIRLIDLIAPIARICRFNSGLASHYSVAEHCILGSYRCSSPIHFMLHDLPEAIVGDLPAPIKQYCPDYKAIEAKIDTWLWRVFDVGPPPPDLKSVDMSMLVTEQQHFGRPAEALDYFMPYHEMKINCWEPVTAALKYIDRLQELFNVQLRLDATLEWESPGSCRR
jgi:hypothetical protein